MKLMDFMMDTTIAVRYLQAIGQAQRLAIFRQLAKAGDQGMTAGSIASYLNDFKILNPESLASQSYYVRKSSQNDETSLSRNLS